MKTHTATVKKVVRVGKDIAIIYFTVPGFTYAAGQYITVFFDGASRPEGKAYSLSSAPHQPLQSITVKRVGEFSGRLCSLAPGDTFTCSPAYGHFNPAVTTPLVCIAAGVGIAPVWSVIKSELRSNSERDITLVYTVTNTAAMPHRHSIARQAAECANFTARQHITRQVIVPPNAQKERISVSKCLRPGAVYLLCGSVTFVRDMWQGLTEWGVAPEAISTEVFFE